MKVLWSDEKWWYLHPPKNRSIDRVWAADINEVPTFNEVKWSDKGCFEIFMFWGGMTGTAVTLESSFRTGSRRFRFDQVFYRNKVLKHVFANIKKRTKKTNDIFTTKLFSAKKWIFQQDGARPHQVN